MSMLITLSRGVPDLLVNAMRGSILKIVDHMHLEKKFEMVHEAGAEQPRYIKHSIWRGSGLHGRFDKVPHCRFTQP